VNPILFLISLAVGSFIFGFFMQAGVALFMWLTGVWEDDDDNDFGAIG
jgi:uncharacterized membrane protein YvlD (DUF360 family)